MYLRITGGGRVGLVVGRIWWSGLRLLLLLLLLLVTCYVLGLGQVGEAVMLIVGNRGTVHGGLLGQS